MKDSTAPVKGIRISRMSAVIIVISLILYALLTATVIHVSGSLQTLYHAVNEFSESTQLAELFSSGSDFLTEQARLYVSAKDPVHMSNYFLEIEFNHRRDDAVELLQQYDLEPETIAHLQSALDKSALLIEREIRAMALASLAWGCDENTLPEEIRNAPLTAEERSMSKEEQLARAQDLVFGADYQDMQEQIAIDVENLLYEIFDVYGNRMEMNNEQIQRALLNHQVLIALHFTATMAGFIFIFLLVVRPLRNYVKQIEYRKPIQQLTGAYECKRLAQSYNAMLAFITANEQLLRQRAEHDALTGLLNRGAFDELQASLEAYDGPLAFLLVDVDKFKEVNDGHGHETGDRVLKKVAGLLSRHFRATDYPVRIGGDEFAVIVMDAVPEEQDTIAEKIAAINKILTNPTDGLPVVSLSVGGAFSKGGFSQNLYQNADSALYKVKEHGRCGCRFYNPGETEK